MFTFINAILLPALALAILPIIIHLMNRKKTRLVPFSSLMFLKSLQKHKMRRLKIRQIVLLALRCLILLLAVLAFTRPVSVAGDRGDIAGHHPTSVVLIVDNSMSAGYVSDRGPAIDRIKNRTLEILDFLKEGDEAVVLSVRDAEPMTFSGNLSELKARVRSMSPRHARLDMADAFHRAVALLKSARHPNREVYVLSDMQAVSFAKERMPFYDETLVRPVFVSFEASDAGHTSLRQVAVVSRIPERQKPLRLEATVRQDGPSRGDNLLALFLDGRRVGQTPVVMENGPDEKTLTFAAASSRAGFVNGYAELEDDPLMADNRYYFHTYVPSDIRVLLVGVPGRETEILRLALAPSEDFVSPIRVSRVVPSQFLSAHDADYDVIVFAGVVSFSESDIQRLAAFTKRGGGLVVWPGPGADVSSYGHLMNRLGMGVTAGTVTMRESALMFERVDGSHPVLSGLFQARVQEESVESPRVSQYVKVIPSATAVVPITLTDHSPFLVENRTGEGSVFFFATSVHSDWSDLALRGVFPALLHRCIQYLATSGRMGEGTFRTEEAIEVTQKHVSAEGVVVTGPSGDEILPKIRMAGSEAVLSLPGLPEPGHYIVRHRGKIVNVIDVNVPSEESELRSATASEMDAMFGADQYTIISENDSIEAYILQSRFGREWWKWLLGGVLILALVETVVAQSHRFGKNETKEIV